MPSERSRPFPTEMNCHGALLSAESDNTVRASDFLFDYPYTELIELLLRDLAGRAHH